MIGKVTVKTLPNNLQPMPGRVIVRREESRDMTEGGIVLPDSARESLNRGVVLAVGEGELLDNGKRAAVTIKEGDAVIFPHYNAQQILHDGEELLVLHVRDLLARIVL